MTNRFVKLLLLILLAAVLTSCNSVKKIDLNDYVEIAVDGTNGLGKLSYKLDWKEIDKAIGSQQIFDALKKLNPSSHASLVTSDVQLSCADLFAVYPDRSENLTNGDKVAFFIEPGSLVAHASLSEIEKALKAKFVLPEFDVKDLPEALTIDVFQAFDENSIKFYYTVPGDESSINGIVDLDIKDENRIIYEGNGFLVQYEDEIPSLDPMFSVSKDNETLGYFSFCGSHYFMTGYKEGDLWPVYITDEDVSILNDYGFALKRNRIDYVVKNIGGGSSE